MADPRIEPIILRNLIYNEDFTRRVLPYIKEEYFQNIHEKSIFKYTQEYVTKFNTLPSLDALAVMAGKDTVLHETTFKEIEETLEIYEVAKDKKVDQDWLIGESEIFCKDKAMMNAAYKAVNILEGNEKKLDKGAIPKLFEDALSISFDPSNGHDYFDDAEERFNHLHDNPTKIPFDIGVCNKETKNGVKGGTLNVLAAGIHVGKTLGLCHLASSYLKSGKDTLYITLEMEAMDIALRNDQNILSISSDDLINVPKDQYLRRLERAHSQTIGKLKVKQYPAASVHANNFRALLHDLKLKQQFIPKVIIIDYLNLCLSSRIKSGDNSYGIMKAVAEELRALAQELNVPIWTAIQLNRGGAGSSDPSMEDVAESHGIPATADLMWGLVRNDKLDELGQLLVVQMKNRYKDLTERKRFYIGLDRQKMRWYDVDQKGQHQAAEDSDAPATAKDDPDNHEAVKLAVSAKYGSQAYQSAYQNVGKQFGPRKNKFADFKV